jgi:hypothetical protein
MWGDTGNTTTYTNAFNCHMSTVEDVSQKHPTQRVRPLGKIKWKIYMIKSDFQNC